MHNDEKQPLKVTPYSELKDQFVGAPGTPERDEYDAQYANDSKDIESLGVAFPKELVRVREILGHYKSIGPAGALGARMIEIKLQAADKAMIEGDVVAMLELYTELTGIE